MIDQPTREQVRIVIEAAKTALDQIILLTGDREVAFRVAPSSTFLNFAALSQLSKQPPTEQLAWINAGRLAVKEVLAGDTVLYAKGRNCAPVTREMAEKAVEVSRDELGRADLVVRRKDERTRIRYKALLEFCATDVLLAPADTGRMMSMANELVATVIASEGPLGKNVIKLH